jgi:plasmid stabilization system protein ParE
MRIEYHPAIEAELAEIRDFYNERSQKLGYEFINEFERTVLRIAAMPTRWMIVRGDTRRASMKRFPYTILFRMIDGPVIRVTVIKHERRHPSYGIHRK